MRDILPSCFGGHDDLHTHDLVRGLPLGRNLVTCLYNAKLADQHVIVYVSWCKTRRGQGFFVHIDDPTRRLTCNVGMKPWHLWKKQGCKSFESAGLKVEVMWDLSCAKYMPGPEPHAGYYIIVTCERSVVLVLGDMLKAALKKANAEHAASPPATVLLSRREHIGGKQLYATKAQFCDSSCFHDIVIECHTGSKKESCLSVCVDKQIVVQIKQLMWNFRGNRTVLIDGLPTLVFWDVYDWLFNPSDGTGHAVFMFQTCMSDRNPWNREMGLLSMTLLSDSEVTSNCQEDADRKIFLHQGSCCASKLHWPLSNSFKSKVQHQGPLGFSLILYAWRTE